MLEGVTHIALFAVCGFVAGTAILGGITLAAGWQKRWYGTELLAATPYNSYVIPGLILTIAVGGSAAWAALVTWYNPYVGSIAAMIGGCILMGWIVAEIYLIRRPLGLSTLFDLFYFCCGLVMLVLGLVLYQAG